MLRRIFGDPKFPWYMVIGFMAVFAWLKFVDWINASVYRLTGRWIFSGELVDISKGNVESQKKLDEFKRDNPEEYERIRRIVDEGWD